MRSASRGFQNLAFIYQTDVNHMKLTLMIKFDTQDFISLHFDAKKTMELRNYILA